MKSAGGPWVSGGLVQWEVVLPCPLCYTWRSSHCVKLCPLKAAGNVNIGADICVCDCVFVCVCVCEDEELCLFRNHLKNNVCSIHVVLLCQ